MAQTATRTDFALNLERTFAAPRDRVWRAWTDPDEIRRWWSRSGLTVEIAEFDVRVGGRFRLGMRSAEDNLYVVGGAYSEVDPPTRLVHTWQWEEDGSDGAPEMLVTVEFHDEGAATRLVLTHENFRNGEAAERHQDGWTNKFDCLAGYLEEE
jgi:uncharacterized protein YndB with AHSA1/START domain